MVIVCIWGRNGRSANSGPAGALRKMSRLGGCSRPWHFGRLWPACCLLSCIHQRWGELKAAPTNNTMAEQPPPSDGQSGPSLRLRPKGPPLGKRVIIIGGGIGGLTAARALLDIGCEVRPAAVGRRGNRDHTQLLLLNVPTYSRC